MDDSGEIDTEAAIAMLPDELKDALAPSIRKCKDVRKYLLFYIFIIFK